MVLKFEMMGERTQERSTKGLNKGEGRERDSNKKKRLGGGISSGPNSFFQENLLQSSQIQTYLSAWKHESAKVQEVLTFMLMHQKYPGRNSLWLPHSLLGKSDIN